MSVEQARDGSPSSIVQSVPRPRVLREQLLHALSLILTLFGVAVLFVAQEAQFLAVVQVIVYAGAIVVLFLFVIMLLGVDRTDDLRIEPLRVQRPVAVVIGCAVYAIILKWGHQLITGIPLVS